MKPPRKILILLAHPVLERSRVHQRLIQHVRHIEGVTVHDLYERYPEFDIDVKKEQQLLLEHDVIIWQHPFYWYSAPPLLKQWMDLVLAYGWAYGKNGTQLHGKIVMNVLSCGGTENAYCAGGKNRYSVKQLLAPFDQTAFLTGMKYWPPFVVHGTYTLEVADIEMYAIQYEQLLSAITWNRVNEEQLASMENLNQFTPVPAHLQD